MIIYIVFSLGVLYSTPEQGCSLWLRAIERTIHHENTFNTELHTGTCALIEFLPYYIDSLVCFTYFKF